LEGMALEDIIAAIQKFEGNNDFKDCEMKWKL
jgi:hypothetical protein